MSGLSHRIGVALCNPGGIFKRWDQQDAVQRVQVQDRVDRLLPHVIDPILRAVLEHHRPVHEVESSSPVCRGCDTDGEPEAEPAPWPCSTWRLIEHHLPGS